MAKEVAGLLASPELPPQSPANLDYPITVYLHDRFFIDAGDADGAFHGLQHALHAVDGVRFDALIEVARARHGALVDRWHGAFEEQRRQANIIERRPVITDPVHRFFLAVVLNAPDRRSILQMVAGRFPERDVLASLLRGGDEREVLADLASRYGASSVEPQGDEIRELIAAFRTSLFFAPCSAHPVRTTRPYD